MGDTKNKVDTNQIRFENGLEKLVTDICFHQDQVNFGSFNYLTSYINSNVCWFMKIDLRKWNFFGVKEFFSWMLVSKMGLEMNLRIITKNHAADPEIEFLKESI